MIIRKCFVSRCHVYCKVWQEEILSAKQKSFSSAKRGSLIAQPIRRSTAQCVTRQAGNQGQSHELHRGPFFKYSMPFEPNCKAGFSDKMKLKCPLIDLTKLFSRNFFNKSVSKPTSVFAQGIGSSFTKGRRQIIHKGHVYVLVASSLFHAFFISFFNVHFLLSSRL